MLPQVAVSTCEVDHGKMDSMEIASSPHILAGHFGLVFGQTRCQFCNAIMPTAAVWVSSYEERDEEEEASTGGPAILRFTEWLDEAALNQIHTLAPWLRFAYTRTSCTTYLAHHCTTCGALMGDHYVHSPEGPYWPHDDTALASLRFLPCRGALQARSCPGESSWMERVESDCSRE